MKNKIIKKYFDNYHVVNYDNFVTYEDAAKYYHGIDPFEESEEDRVERENREKAIRRNQIIDSILG